MKVNHLVSIAAAIIAAAAGYGLGRLHTGAETIQTSDVDTPVPGEAPTLAQPASPEPAGMEHLLDDLADIAEAARTISMPDARTYAFFENLELESLPAAADFIEDLPAGNERDVLFAMAIRRWALLDGPKALDRATAFPDLGTRNVARTTAYRTWAEHDSEAALLRAVNEPEHERMILGIEAVVAGAAAIDPGDAITLWNIAPKKFLDSVASQQALEQLVEAAYGTGKRDDLTRLIDELPTGEMKTLMANALVTNWARHYPDDAYNWLRRAVPPGEEREAVTDNMFAAMTYKDPAMAADWADRNVDLEKQPVYLAAAVGQWAQVDLAGAEIWMNEQTSGYHLDGASFALAQHHLENGEMQSSFAWIRRVHEPRNRAELLMRLGRRWSGEEPMEFKRFIEESSLSPSEVEMLLSDAAPKSEG